MLVVARLSSSYYSTLHSEKHCAREKIIEELFSEGLREIVTIDCVKKLLGNCFQGNCAFLLSLSDFLLFL